MTNQIPAISRRLSAAADLVTPGNRLADVGTDHGYLPIYLCASGITPYAIAMDLRSGPLSRAEEHVREYNLNNHVELRLSDGLEQLSAGEADTLTVMGMGGMLISNILQKYPDVTRSMKELVLGPQSEFEILRRTLQKNLHFKIDRETMIEEENKFYPLIHAVPDDSASLSSAGKPGREIEIPSADLDERNNAQDFADFTERVRMKYGPRLLEQKDPVLHRYLVQQHQVFRSIAEKLSQQSSAGAAARYLEIKEELRLLEAALKMYEHKM